MDELQVEDAGYDEEEAEAGRVKLDPAERGVSVTLGAALIAFSASRERSLRSLALAAAGAYLAYRGITGHCALYARLAGTAEDDEEGRLDAGGHDDRSAEAAVTVALPPADVHAFWRRPENLPRFMKMVQSVEERGGGRSLWTARGPAGEVWQWEAETLEDRPGALLVWRSLAGSDIHHQLAVRFQPAPGGGTEVCAATELRLPAGPVGRALARFGRRAMEAQAREDLRRFKQVIEAGETPIAGFPRGPEDGAEETE